MGAPQAFEQKRAPEDERRPERRYFASLRSFVYKTTPQGELSIFVHYPFDWMEGDQRPAILFFFGGAYRRGSVDHFGRQATYLASRGIVAARADYRVSERHGTTPIECVEDGKSAVRWLRSHAGMLGIDPRRIVVAGGSSGGHIAACAAFDGLEAPAEDASISTRPDALVLFNPAPGPGWGEGRPPLEAGGDRGRDRPQLLATPLLRWDESKVAPPTLVHFGTADRFLDDARPFMARVEEAGGRVELALAEGMSHAYFNSPPWLMRTLHRTDEFLASLGYLRGKPTFEAP